MCDVKTYAKWWQGASRGESVRVVMVIERPTCSLAGQQINITEEMKYNYVLTSITDDTSATYFSLILSLYVLAHILHRG